MTMAPNGAPTGWGPPASDGLGGLYAGALHEWESKLGDPAASGPFSFAAAAEHDEGETFPGEALAALGALGASALQIPAQHGGPLRSLEQLVAASYAIGRRDPSLSLIMGLRMWSQLVWMAGSAAQQRSTRALLERNGAIALAASEAAHGADLLSNETAARRTPSGYALHGEKWPIGSARHCEAAFVLARTGAERGPRALSWFLVDSDALRRPQARRLDKVRTLGFRAADLAGFAFDGLELGRDDAIGNVGAGLELALKVFQVTRPLVASLSLGPGDTAVRLAAEFVLQRQLYGGLASDLPAVRRSLTAAWVRFVLAEVVNIAAVRSAHLHPEGLDVAALVCKILVPKLVREAIDRSAEVLGARFFLREHAHGTFQKVYRDQSVVSIFDGSTDVCLQALAKQLPLLLASAPANAGAHVAELATTRRSVPAMAYDRLEIFARGGDPLLAGLAGLGPLQGHPAERALAAVLERVERERRDLGREVAALRESGGAQASRTVHMVDIAARYARLHALGAAAAFVAHNRGAPLAERPAWLWQVAELLLGDRLPGAPPAEEATEELFELLRDRVHHGALLSFSVQGRGSHGSHG